MGSGLRSDLDPRRSVRTRVGLALGFSDMVSSLTEQERQLRDLNQTLEERVRERTREARTLALVARHTDNAVLIADGRQRIEWVNEGFTRLTGYSLADALGRRQRHRATVADEIRRPTVGRHRVSADPI